MRALRNEMSLGKVLYPQTYRAIALIAVMLFVVAFGSALFRFGSLAVDAVTLHTADDLQGVVSTFGPSDIPSSIDRMVDGYDSVAPSSFAGEVLDGPNGRYSIDDDGVIAGFAMSGRVESVAEKVLLEMSERGWCVVPSGQSSVTTLVKSQGVYRWAVLSCEAMGQETSVVLNVRERYERSR